MLNDSSILSGENLIKQTITNILKERLTPTDSLAVRPTEVAFSIDELDEELSELLNPEYQTTLSNFYRFTLDIVRRTPKPFLLLERWTFLLYWPN